MGGVGGRHPRLRPSRPHSDLSVALYSRCSERVWCSSNGMQFDARLQTETGAKRSHGPQMWRRLNLCFIYLRVSDILKSDRTGKQASFKKNPVATSGRVVLDGHKKCSIKGMGDYTPLEPIPAVFTMVHGCISWDPILPVTPPRSPDKYWEHSFGAWTVFHLWGN